ncbi:uncharacterized protein VTP21DRAFT_221 [Calcarisporiella thermophila]|uniref:uncharacterized protein n=1 Tax=Calcarisporiella thermophila TaxID=911321 RepID=UPI0037420196
MSISRVLFVVTALLFSISLSEAACGLSAKYGKGKAVCFGTGTEVCRRLAAELSGEYDCEQYSVRGWRCKARGKRNCEKKQQAFIDACSKYNGSSEVEKAC